MPKLTSLTATLGPKADITIRHVKNFFNGDFRQQGTFASSKPAPRSDSPLTATEPYADHSADKALRPVWLSMIS